MIAAGMLPPGAVLRDPRLIEFETLSSTNAWLATSVGALPDETWVRADRQSSGRGRQGRPWQSLPGNLFASVLVQPRRGEGPHHQLSFVAALALYDAAIPFCGRARLALKWPNDLMLGGAKCAGILLERAGDACVVGFGVNILSPPPGLQRRTAALAQGGHPPPSPASFLHYLRDCFARTRADWRREGFPRVRERWLARATQIGHRTTVTLGSALLEGRFAGLAEDGALLLERDGVMQTIYAGDVWED